MSLPELAGSLDASDLAVDFDRNGHVCVRGLASRDEVEAFRPALERVALANPDPRPLEDLDMWLGGSRPGDLVDAAMNPTPGLPPEPGTVPGCVPARPLTVIGQGLGRRQAVSGVGH